MNPDTWSAYSQHYSRLGNNSQQISAPPSLVGYGSATTTSAMVQSPLLLPSRMQSTSANFSSSANLLPSAYDPMLTAFQTGAAAAASIAKNHLSDLNFARHTQPSTDISGIGNLFSHSNSSWRTSQTNAFGNLPHQTEKATNSKMPYETPSRNDATGDISHLGFNSIYPGISNSQSYNFISSLPTTNPFTAQDSGHCDVKSESYGASASNLTNSKTQQRLGSHLRQPGLTMPTSHSPLYGNFPTNPPLAHTHPLTHSISSHTAVAAHQTSAPQTFLSTHMTHSTHNATAESTEFEQKFTPQDIPKNSEIVIIKCDSKPNLEDLDTIVETAAAKITAAENVVLSTVNAEQIGISSGAPPPPMKSCVDSMFSEHQMTLQDLAEITNSEGNLPITALPDADTRGRRGRKRGSTRRSSPRLATFPELRNQTYTETESPITQADVDALCESMDEKVEETQTNTTAVEKETLAQNGNDASVKPAKTDGAGVSIEEELSFLADVTALIPKESKTETEPETTENIANEVNSFDPFGVKRAMRRAKAQANLKGNKNLSIEDELGFLAHLPPICNVALQKKGNVADTASPEETVNASGYIKSYAKFLDNVSESGNSESGPMFGVVPGNVRILGANADSKKSGSPSRKQPENGTESAEEKAKKQLRNLNIVIKPLPAPVVEKAKAAADSSASAGPVFSTKRKVPGGKPPVTSQEFQRLNMGILGENVAVPKPVGGGKRSGGGSKKKRRRTLSPGEENSGADSPLANSEDVGEPTEADGEKAGRSRRESVARKCKEKTIEKKAVTKISNDEYFSSPEDNDEKLEDSDSDPVWTPLAKKGEKKAGSESEEDTGPGLGKRRGRGSNAGSTRRRTSQPSRLTQNRNRGGRKRRQSEELGSSTDAGVNPSDDDASRGSISNPGSNPAVTALPRQRVPPVNPPVATLPPAKPTPPPPALPPSLPPPAVPSSTAEASQASPVSDINFKTGDFVISISDKEKEDPPIWKIDGKSLLQKYEMIIEDGKKLYKSISTYSGWSTSHKLNYEPISVRVVRSERQTTTVEYIRSDSLDDSKVMQTYSRLPLPPPPTAFNEKDNPQEKEHFEVYLQTLVSQALDPSFIPEILKDNDTYFVTHVSEIDKLCERLKIELRKCLTWPAVLQNCCELLPVYEEKRLVDTEGQLCCQCCKKRLSARRIEYSGNPYDPVELGTLDRDIIKARVPQKVFIVCMTCLESLAVYSHVTHQKYNFFLKCREKVDIVRRQNPSKETHEVLEYCLQDAEWINELFTQALQIWNKAQVVTYELTTAT